MTISLDDGRKDSLMTPRLTIVIANYNFGRFLGAAIDSILEQLSPHDQSLPGKVSGNQVEIIVCDGGSIDDSVDVIRKYAGDLPPNTKRTNENSRLAWWCSEKDKGQSDAFNKGFSHASGKFLIWLNADDILTPGSLAAVFKEMDRHPECEWFIGSSLWADENLVVTRCFCAHRFSWLRARYGFLSVGGPSSFFTKRLLDSVGGIDESLHYVMDTDLWHRFCRAGVRFRRMRHNVFAYRQHEASKMSGADKHTTERALANRKKAHAESLVLAERYGSRGGLSYRVAHLLSLSVIDNIIAWWRTIRWRGKHAGQI